MKNNVGNFPGTVIPVHAAIVDDATAAEKDHLTFKGESNQYWGFRVDHDGQTAADTVTYDVPTQTLAALRVRTRPRLALAATGLQGSPRDRRACRAMSCIAGMH